MSTVYVVGRMYVLESTAFSGTRNRHVPQRDGAVLGTLQAPGQCRMTPAVVGHENV